MVVCENTLIKRYLLHWVLLVWYQSERVKRRPQGQVRLLSAEPSALPPSSPPPPFVRLPPLAWLFPPLPPLLPSYRRLCFWYLFPHPFLLLIPNREVNKIKVFQPTTYLIGLGCLGCAKEKSLCGFCGGGGRSSSKAWYGRGGSVLNDGSIRFVVRWSTILYLWLLASSSYSNKS